MPNPCKAFPNTYCENCDQEFGEDEYVYFTDDGKLCKECAESGNYVCACGNFKKSQFETCYKCKIGDK